MVLRIPDVHPPHRQHAGGPAGNDLEGRHDRIERETESLFLLGEVKEDVL